MTSTLTIRRKFVLALAAVALGVAALVGVLGYQATAHVLDDEIDRSLASAATTLSTGGTVTSVITEAADIGRGGGPPDDGEQGIVQSAQTVTAGGTVTLLMGLPLPITNDAARLAAQPAGDQYLDTVVVAGTDYRVLAMSVGGDRGLIQVGRDLTVTEDVLAQLALNTVLVGFGVLAAAAAAGWLIARQITRRLTALTAAAEHIGVTGVTEYGSGFGELRQGHDEVSRLGNAMQAMLAELTRSRDDQRRLVQDAGHELRTPLTSLRTNISVLKRYDELPPPSRVRLLDDVQSETRELTNLVNELIELATDRRDAETPETFDLTELAAQITHLYHRRSGRDIRIKTVQPVSIRARRHSIERALSNLVDNAVKFDPDGTAPVEISIDRHADHVSVAVSDRGPGIGADDTARIFDRFYRSTTARSQPGSGLGLAIVKDIAAAHGGTVTAADRTGGGAVISFALHDSVLVENDTHPGHDPGRRS